MSNASKVCNAGTWWTKFANANLGQAVSIHLHGALAPKLATSPDLIARPRKVGT
jgi:hypothetical protein